MSSIKDKLSLSGQKREIERMEGYYTVKLTGGLMGIIKAHSLSAAYREAILDQGRANVSSVKPATEEDLTWFKNMGGRDL